MQSALVDEKSCHFVCLFVCLRGLLNRRGLKLRAILAYRILCLRGLLIRRGPKPRLIAMIDDILFERSANS